MARKKHYIFFLLILCALLQAAGYTPAKAHMRAPRGAGDTLRANTPGSPLLPAGTLATDSLAADSLVADTLAADSAAQEKGDELKAPVPYTANDSIIFTFDSASVTHLYGESRVSYEQSVLEAEVISMNMDSSTVFAHGVADSTGKEPVGLPVFTDGGTPYESETMRYNFKSKRGFIHNVNTQQGEGFVISYNAKKDSLNNLYMRSGMYTTCDNKEHPHFYLALTRAKARVKKNVVFGPAYLVVEDVPLPLGIPFGFFPFTSSYSSGFIMPSYGDEMERGFYLRDGGYYFAISDYMDLRLTGEIFTKGSWGLNAMSNYNKRYKYSGNFNLSYLYTKTGEKNMPDYATSRDFKIQWSHRQDAKSKPNTSFSASVNFSTSSYEHSSLDSYYNPALFSQNTKTSSINYTRTFPDKKLTISGGLNLSQSSSDSTISVSFPNLSVSVSTFYPFKRKKAAGAERWYEKIRMSYSGQLANSITTKENRLFKSNIIKDWRNAIKHEIPVSATFTLFDYLNISPSFRYTERWYTHKVNQSMAGGELVRDTVWGFNRVYNYTASLSFSTKLYGMYTPLVGKKVKQVRHVFTPTVTLSAAPDFGASRYGYYKTYTYIDAYGHEQTVEYSPYAGQLYGVPGRGKTGSVTLDVSNNVEMKVASRRDSSGVRKISLIDELGGSLSYNMAAATRPWSDLSLRVRLKLSESYTFNLSSTFATYAYEFDENGNVRVGDRTEWSYGRFGRFAGTSFSYSYTFNNQTWKKWFPPREKSSGEEPPGATSSDATAATPATSPTTPAGGGETTEKQAETDPDGYETFSMPWSFTVSYSCRISENTSAPINPRNMRYPYRLTHSLSASGSLKISNKWNFSFSTAYDFDAHEIATTTCNISRDLHCFTITGSLNPFGRWKSYNFTIRAKSSLLQDLKWEEKSSYSNNVRWY